MRGTDDRRLVLDDYCSILYNSTFKTTIFVTKSGSVSIYNIEDGSDSIQFCIPNSFKESSGSDGTNLDLQKTTSMQQQSSGASNFIVQAILDGSDKRLIVLTVSGALQFWNFTCGMLLFEVDMQVVTSSISYSTRNFTHSCHNLTPNLSQLHS